MLRTGVLAGFITAHSKLHATCKRLTDIILVFYFLHPKPQILNPPFNTGIYSDRPAKRIAFAAILS